MAPPWTTSPKTVSSIPTSHDRASVARAPILGYSPPVPRTTITFHPSALFTAMARCAAIRRVAPAVSAALVVGSRELVGELVDDTGSSFDLSADVEAMADFERTGLTGRLGGGFADLVMAAMGYAWMDLSSELLPRNAGPLGDFVYDGPPTGGNGVVMTEAKATCASSVVPADVRGIAERGYRAQVAPHIGRTVPGVGGIFHGYAICFGAAPGIPGGLGHVVETAVATTPGGSAGGPAVAGGSPAFASVGGRLAVGSYRAVFDLVGAPTLHLQLDRLLAGLTAAPPLKQIFRRVRIADRWFLSGADPNPPRRGMPPGSAPLMLAEEVAEPLLAEISRLLSAGPRNPHELPPVWLPTVAPVLSPDDVRGGKLEYVLFPDGLAQPLGSIEEGRHRTWTVADGLEPLSP